MYRGNQVLLELTPIKLYSLFIQNCIRLRPIGCAQEMKYGGRGIVFVVYLPKQYVTGFS